MDFISTRGNGGALSGAEAVIKGIAADGGLFVPSSFPVFNDAELRYMASLEYAALASYIMGRFFTDIPPEELKKLCAAAYSKFEDSDPAPVIRPTTGFSFASFITGRRTRSRTSRFRYCRI